MIKDFVQSKTTYKRFNEWVEAALVEVIKLGITNPTEGLNIDPDTIPRRVYVEDRDRKDAEIRSLQQKIRSRLTSADTVPRALLDKHMAAKDEEITRLKRDVRSLEAAAKIVTAPVKQKAAALQPPEIPDELDEIGDANPWEDPPFWDQRDQPG